MQHLTLPYVPVLVLCAALNNLMLYPPTPVQLMVSRPSPSSAILTWLELTVCALDPCCGVCQGAGFEVVMASVGRAYRTDKELMEQHTRLRMVNRDSIN